MNMRALAGNLPSAYEYDGRVYEVQTDFREWIKFEMLLTDPDIILEDKARRLEEIVFNEIPEDPELWAFISWFYNCGRDYAGSGEKKSPGKKQSAVYSYEHDFGYIYAAFLELYGIDLVDVQHLHWWKFKSLFWSLHDCKFTDIVGYRSEKITSKTPDYRKEFLTNAKKIYALPRSLSEQQKIEELKRIKEKMGY